MPKIPLPGPNIKAQSTRPRRGFRLPAGYEGILKEAVEQDARQPEDANQTEIQNRLKQFGGPNVTD